MNFDDRLWSVCAVYELGAAVIDRRAFKFELLLLRAFEKETKIDFKF